MATQTIPATGTTSQQASARAHFERRDTWHHVRIDGTRYVMMTSATSGKLYTVRADGRGCSCDAMQKWDYPVCAHMLSIRLEIEERAEIERQHQAALQDWLDTMDEPAPTPKASYAALFPKCKRCPDIADGSDGLCGRCSSDVAWEARIADKRATPREGVTV